MNPSKAAPILVGMMLLPLLAACGRQPPAGSLVITQVPSRGQSASTQRDILDERYPVGSRVVLASPPFNPKSIRVLSEGLLAAGGAVASPDGHRVLFAGKATPSATWQIYETKSNGGRATAITAADGGAMDPAILAEGAVVFSSPVPKQGETWKTNPPAALFVQSSKGEHRQITFGTSAAVEPTVLADGRILFVSARPIKEGCDLPTSLALFTVNNDGTEITAFALDSDGAPAVHRPRELLDGRVAFVAADHGSASGFRAETVRTARPFASRSGLEALKDLMCRSIEPGGAGTLLVCTKGNAGSAPATMAVYRIGADAASLGELLFDDTAWDDIEAIAVDGRPKPIGHISAMAPDKPFGTILCLDANFIRPSTNSVSAKAQRVRVTVVDPQAKTRTLGEVPVHSDGSFLAEVPADTAFGLETLDADGKVLQKVPPAIWVRRGENRTCIGCHEPYNRSPRNRRPLAVTEPPVVLSQTAQIKAATNP